jgi:hypothetical protein
MDILENMKEDIIVALTDLVFMPKMHRIILYFSRVCT